MGKEQKINKDTIVCISIAAKPGNFGANFHNSAYKHLNINWVYLPRKVVSATDLERAINGVRALSIKGCSVSMPHKEAVVRFLDELDLSAERIGAVNTIVQNDNGDLKGYNTDFYGSKKALEKTEIKGKEVLMLGAGGVAKAVGLAVKELGGVLTIANRTYDRAIELSEKLKTRAIHWEQVKNSSAYLLINATSVGMKKSNEMVVNEEVINNFDVVMDVVIYPAETKLLRIAKEKGKEVIPGIFMCVYQAAEQFKIYTGFDAPKEIVDRTIKVFE
ncbi:MAG: shikimate dehydrogenase [Bacteroidetes bacterium]|nr:shikimate dehydrogenase [Bacteroidota bacterium]